MQALRSTGVLGVRLPKMSLATVLGVRLPKMSRATAHHCQCCSGCTLVDTMIPVVPVVPVVAVVGVVPEVQSDVWCHIMSRVRDITMPPQFRCRMVGLWISKGKTDHVITPPRKRLLCVP